MRVGRDEAVMLLRRWSQAPTALRCNFESPILVFTMKGHVFALENEKVTVLSEDHESELVFMLAHIQKFHQDYSEKGPEYGTALVCKFAEHSLVSFTEMRGV